jgi:hypothetical protein
MEKKVRSYHSLGIFMNLLQIRRRDIKHDSYLLCWGLKPLFLHLQYYYEKIEKPFHWKFTREEPTKILSELFDQEQYHETMLIAA